MRTVQCLLLVALLLWQVTANPVLNHDPSSHPGLSAVTDLTARLTPRLGKDARLPLPGPQDIEAIKKVAQILAMLGEQVIPAIIGEPPGTPCEDDPVDPVDN